MIRTSNQMLVESPSKTRQKVEDSVPPGSRNTRALHKSETSLHTTQGNGLFCFLGCYQGLATAATDAPSQICYKESSCLESLSYWSQDGYSTRFLNLYHT